MNRYYCLVILLFGVFMNTAAAYECRGLFKDKKIDQKTFDEVMTLHDLWLGVKNGKKEEYSEIVRLRTNVYVDDYSPNPKGKRANLCRAVFDKNIDFSNRVIMDVDFRGAVLKNISFSGTNIMFSDFSYAKLSESKFSNADASYAKFHEAMLYGVKIDNSIFHRAEFNKAHVDNAEITNSKFTKAIFDNASFLSSSFEKVNMSSSSMIKAHGSDSYFGEVDLYGAKISNVIFSETDLEKCDLSNADLTEGFFEDGSFISSDLTDAILKNAIFSFVDFKSAKLLANPDHLPSLIRFSYSKNIDKSEFFEVSDEGVYRAPFLTAIRNGYKENGLVDDAKKLTYFLRKEKQKREWDRGFFEKINSAAQYFAFDLTVKYGYSPWSAIQILFAITLLMSFYYYYELSNDSVNKIMMEKKEFIEEDGVVVLTGDIKRYEVLLADKFERFKVSFYFSLLSSFHIGWREINLGNWLVRLQKSEFTYVPIAGIRRVSGIQSLLGVYLLALSILSFFGDPFS